MPLYLTFRRARTSPWSMEEDTSSIWREIWRPTNSTTAGRAANSGGSSPGGREARGEAPPSLREAGEEEGVEEPDLFEPEGDGVLRDLLESIEGDRDRDAGERERDLALEEALSSS